MKPHQRLRLVRFMMILSSFAPLFILWAIRGTYLITDSYLIPVCIALIVIPLFCLGLRIVISKRSNDLMPFYVGKTVDIRDHLLIYLFAMLLPLYSIDLSGTRELAAVLVALILIAFLFWHLDLYHMNLFFAVFGYNVFTSNPVKTDNPISGKHQLVLITKRGFLQEGETINAYRLSDTVYFESGGT